MAKRSRLLASLNTEKGVHHKLEIQKKFQKQATKRKRSTLHQSLAGGVEPLMSGALQPEKDDTEENQGNDGLEVASAAVRHVTSQNDKAFAADSIVNVNSTSGVGAGGSSDKQFGRIQEKPSNLESKAPSKMNGRDDSEALGSQQEEEEEEGIPLSDIENATEDEQGDIIPYQRLTINNIAALTKAYRSITLPIAQLAFSEHQIVTSAEPISIQDVDDDLNRELAFHRQCLHAAKEAKLMLKKEGVAFSRPADYFAEMVKSDEHMGKIKQRMTNEAADKKAAVDARKLRDLKKFGKQVQVAKLQARDKAKRETLDRINTFKRKRRNNEEDGADETKLFDVALEDTSTLHKAARGPRMGGASNKRQKKEDKFGFGGKKRFAKSGDVVSTSDLRAFSTRKMKGQKKGPSRPGKSRRAQK
ncbi:MAG: hypothetical protein Q9220_005353 [cf. Caloplaca sp. 1 TL-2023]